MQKGGVVQISAKFSGDLEKAYDAAVAEWKGEQDQAKSGELYRAKVFPMGCERIRAARKDVPPLDLLFVPVGTQPYAPILAVVGNPSKCVALLESKTSGPFGREVESSLLAVGGRTTFIHVLIDETSFADIGNKMKAVYDSRGLPDGARVGADITGGRKTMSAAVAGVGSMFGWRLFYVDGIQERGKMGYTHGERIVELPNILDIFGRRRREIALELLKAGACRAALREFKELIGESVASDRDHRLALFAEAAMLLRESNFPAFAKKAEKAAMGLGIKFPRAAADLCARVMDDDSEAIGCLLFIVSQIRLAERDLNVAGMLEQQGKQMFLAGTKGSKISARRRKPLLQNAAGIRAISGMFGKGMKGILEKLG